MPKACTKQTFVGLWAGVLILIAGLTLNFCLYKAEEKCYVLKSYNRQTTDPNELKKDYHQE